MKKIIIIEKDKDLSNIIEAELIKSIPDVHIMEYNNASIALEAIRRTNFDVIIANYNLSDKKGLELLNEFEKIGCNWNTIFVVDEKNKKDIPNYVKAKIYNSIIKNDKFVKMLIPSVNSLLDLVGIFKELRKENNGDNKNTANTIYEEMIGIINHEINNPLMAILGNVQILLSKSMSDNPKLIERLRNIENAAHRIATVNTILSYKNKENKQLIK